MQPLSRLRYNIDIPTNRSCGLRAAISIVSGKWKPLILWHLLDGPVRFGKLRDEIAGVSEKVLMEQLQQLERDRIIQRKLVSDKPLVVEYSISPKGETFIPILAAMSAWGFEHVIGKEPSQS